VSVGGELPGVPRGVIIEPIDPRMSYLQQFAIWLGTEWRKAVPFAHKFRAMMDFPFAGDTIGELSVERVDVQHEGIGPGQYAYTARIVLRGPGGQQGVRRALKALFSSHPMTFSGYGNPYQLWFGTPEIESLGDKRYAVCIKGAGARVFLDDELQRFLEYLAEEGQLATQPGPDVAQALVETYLQRYQAEIARKVGRYRSQLRRIEDPGAGNGDT
jgi:hypothetical protein